MTPEKFTWLTERSGKTILYVYIQPRAARTEICGTFREKLKIRIGSPPVEGEANRECIDFLAKTLGVSKSAITLLKGRQSREKTFLISKPIEWVRDKLTEADPECD